MARITNDQHLADILKRLDLLTNWEMRPRSGMRVGLEPIRDLAERLGNPQRRFRSVHVAGTKGKGSTCALIEAGLLRAGFRTGRYGSPHVEHVTERVSLGGHPVSEAALASALQAALVAYEAALAEATVGAAASWFDIVTLAAFHLFAQAEVDWAVVEVGIGGRLDSTNVIDSEVAAVTNIALEHTEILGSTRAEIAAEKAGIIKPATKVVTALLSEDEAGAVVARRAAEVGSPVVWVSSSGDASIEERNVALAGQVLAVLGENGVLAPAGDTAGQRIGLWLLDRATRDRARLPGRMERHDVRVSDGRLVVPVVLDGAHVPFNLQAVLQDLSSDPDLAGPGVVIVGLARDKDAAGLLEVISKHPLRPIVTEFGSADRARSADDLVAIAKSLGLEAEAVADPHQALPTALEAAALSKGWVLVTGSLHLVGLLRDQVLAQKSDTRDG